MPNKCSIINCGATLCRDPNLTFHRLPRSEYKKRIWLEAIGKENLRTDLKNINICSLHFDQNSFNRTLDVIRLKDDAVPSLVIQQPSTLQQSALTAGDDNVNAAGQQNLEFQPSTLHRFSSIATDADSQQNLELVQARKELRRLHEKVNSQKKKIKCLNETVRRQKIKIATFKEVIKSPYIKLRWTKKAPPKSKRMTIPNLASYKCGICSKEFRMKATFKAHMRFHTNYCVCEACGKRCRNNNQLQEHKRARHGLYKIHKCAYCEYSSATKEALTIHERRHTGERPYVCDHCGATFHRRSNLVQHIAIHLPEKNFQCSVCQKWEKSKKRLQVHEYKVHREHKYRYICPVCQDTFTRPGNVRQHLARSHGVPKEDQGVIERYEVHLSTLPEDLQMSGSCQEAPGQLP